MEDAYVIGIRLALDDAVSANIAAIRQDLTALDRAIAGTTAGLRKLAMVAAAGMPGAAQPLRITPPGPPKPDSPQAEPATAPGMQATRPDASSPPMERVSFPVLPISDEPPAAKPAQPPDSKPEVRTSPVAPQPEPQLLPFRPAPPLASTPMPAESVAPPGAAHSPAAYVFEARDPPPTQVAPAAPTPSVDETHAPIRAMQSPPIEAPPRPAPPIEIVTTATTARPSPTIVSAVPSVSPPALPLRPDPRPTLKKSEAQAPLRQHQPARIADPVPSPPMQAGRLEAPPPMRPKLRQIASPDIPGPNPRRTPFVLSSPHPASPPNAAMAATLNTPRMPSAMSATLPPAAPLTAQAAASPTSGDVYLDGARLGQWMASHLAREAGRPTAGTTGFDPRLGVSWPGTRQGG